MLRPLLTSHTLTNKRKKIDQTVTQRTSLILFTTRAKIQCGVLEAIILCKGLLSSIHR